MEEYNRIDIQQICSHICSGGTPKSTVAEYYDGNIPWLNTKEINFNRIYETEKTITEEGLNNSSAKWIPANSVIVAMYGATAGKTAITKIPLTTNQACCNLTIDSTKADYRFVYYALFNDYSYLASLTNGGAQQNLNAQQIKEFEIPFPSLEEQKRIADILSSIDDKIELNRRINENLEQQAQALFKAWFVDFEPFKDGEFVDSEFGMIPKGWDIKPLEYLVTKVKSGDWGKDEPTGNHTIKTFCMRGADFPNIKEGNKGKMPIRYILEKNFREKSLCDGNVVVEISGGSPTQSTGRIVLVDKSFIADCDNALICTNFCKSLEIKENYSFFFYLMWQYLYDSKVMFIYENGSNGLKNLNINSLIERESFVIPTKEVVARFNLVASNLLSTKQANGIEISRLAYLRDTLLPKLMSGELRIDEIEKKNDYE